RIRMPVNDDASCDLPGIGRSDPGGAFPDPRTDVPRGEDRGEAVLAGGCFWCTEAVFGGLAGVRSVEPGYVGGDPATANYTAVCGGDTGHAEAIRVRYDAATISFGQLLKVF